MPARGGARRPPAAPRAAPPGALPRYRRGVSELWTQRFHKRSMSAKLRRAPDLGYRWPMRTVARPPLATLAALCLVLPLACGGGAAESDGAKTPGGTAAGSTGDGGAAPAATESPTTTVALADGGDLQGA